MEVNNLLSKSVEDLNIQLNDVRASITDVDNLLKLILRSLQNSNDNSTKEVLDLINKKVESLLDIRIIKSDKDIVSINKMAVELEAKTQRKRRTNNNSDDTPKRTRQPRKPKTTEDEKRNNKEDKKEESKNITNK